MSWSDGQKLAREQLEDIQAAANGHLVVEEVIDPPDDNSRAQITLSCSTAHLARAPGGLPLKARERFVLFIPRDFPFEVPAIHAAHTRWAGYAHVNWAKILCLYQSSNVEYVPSDGMFGFVDRLNVWLAAGALGQLDPDDAPLHPPLVVATAAERVVVYANAPVVAADMLYWIGAARMAKRNARRLDLNAWSSIDDEFPIAGDNEVIAAAIVLSTPMPFEYPERVYDLIMALIDRDVGVGFLMKFMRLYALSLPDGAPLFMVLGAPMRRREAGGLLKPHLAVWRVDAEAAKALRETLYDETGAAKDAFFAWAVKAKTAWCGLHEAREEITLRRDTETRASWLVGKRLLLLGCGAIGSHLAEYATRAGAATIDLADPGVVTPGILVRQNFADRDVAFPKVQALGARLDAIRPGVVGNVTTSGLRRGITEHFSLSDYDLIIDASASNPLSMSLEREMRTTCYPCPLVSFAVSARAEHGMVMVRMPQTVGGLVHLSRRANLATMRATPSDFAAAFWPKRENIKLFQPEPGCSEPTFVGSAIDIVAHSSALMSLALERLTTLDVGASSVDFIALPTVSAIGEKQRSIVFEQTKSTTDGRYGYRVLIDPIAEREMASWIARNKRVRDARVETGGLIFGAIDDGLQTVWLDRVSGPPPDSEASEEKFICGVAGTREMAEHHSKVSGGSLGFIGIWHTHPVSRPAPSVDDLQAMLQLLVLEKEPPRHVLMVIVGFAADAPRLAAYLFRRRDFRRLLPSRQAASA